MAGLKNILILISKLTIPLLVITLFSCSKKKDIETRFEIEKALNSADRLQEQFSIKSKTLSDNDFQEVLDAYLAVARMVAPPRDNSEVTNASSALRETWDLASKAQTRIANLYMERHNYEEAFNYFKTVADNPATNALQKNAITYYLAVSKEKSKKYVEAAAIYDSLSNGYIAVLKPEKPNLDALDAPLREAEMWYVTGDLDKFNQKMNSARDYYNNLIQKYPSSAIDQAASGKIIASYLKQNRFADAISAMKASKKDSLGNISPSLMIMIADIYSKNLKDYASAESTYKEIIAKNPGSKVLGPAYMGLSLNLFLQNRFAEAREKAKELEGLPQASQQNVAEIYYLIALCLDKEGKWELARGQFDQIMATFPGSDKAYESALFVANHYKMRGETTLANKAFKDAEAYIKKYINPEISNVLMSARAIGYLVKCYLEQNDDKRAIESLKMLHDQFVQTPDGLLSSLKLADIYENVKHDSTSAISWLNTYIKDNPYGDDIDDVKAHIRALTQK